MKLSKTLLVLIDCSTFLSGVFYPYGNPRKILNLWRDEKFTLAVSEEILKEYEDKIKAVSKRLKKDLSFSQAILNLIRNEGMLVIPEAIDPKSCRDSNDLKYLESAASSKANFIVSSDKDLLVLKTFGKTKISSPSEFVKMINQDKM